MAAAPRTRAAAVAVAMRVVKLVNYLKGER